jgi:hypothetical protein
LKKLNKLAKDNSVTISKSIHKHVKKHKSMPSLAEISDDTGLSRQTVSKHLKDLKLPAYLDKYKELTDEVMECLLNSCKAGNVHAMKLYFQLVWKWKPPKVNDPDDISNIDRITTVMISKAESKTTIDVTPKQTEKPKEQKQTENINLKFEKSSKIEKIDPLEPPHFRSGWATI